MKPDAMGFTLIEVLIGTTLLALVMTFIFNGLQFGVTSWTRGERHLERASQIARVGGFFQSHVATIKPITSRINDNLVLSPIEGDDRTFKYTAPMPPRIGVGGLFRFEIYLTDGGDDRSLRLRIYPFDHSHSSKNTSSILPIDDLILAREIQSIEIAYLPEATQDERNANIPADTSGATWVSRWEEDTSPALIKIKIHPIHSPPWPEIIIRPYAHKIN
jgi:general secretion pathway protein J